MVQREAAARDEHAEARGHERACVMHCQIRSLVRARKLAVRERVADQARDEAREREQEPMPVRVDDTGGDLTEAGRPRDADEGPRGECERDRERERHLPPSVLSVVSRHVLVENRLEHTQSHTRPGRSLGYRRDRRAP